MTDDGYPDSPGYKVAGTSQKAANAMAARAPVIRDRVLAYVKAHPRVTADEIADALGLSVLAVRPRVSELRRLGEVEVTGERSLNSSGMTANEWRATAPLPGQPTQQLDDDGWPTAAAAPAGGGENV